MCYYDVNVAKYYIFTQPRGGYLPGADLAKGRFVQLPGLHIAFTFKCHIRRSLKVYNIYDIILWI